MLTDERLNNFLGNFNYYCGCFLDINKKILTTHKKIFPFHLTFSHLVLLTPKSHISTGASKGT